MRTCFLLIILIQPIYKEFGEYGIFKGKNTRLDLFKKMTTFIDHSLGEKQEIQEKLID